jgi:type IV pilus assembly protein PilA
MKIDKGFTLVELMVVVAIIGILSSVAIPNFKKYQAKSKTTEAKLQLASIYSAETALITDFDSFGTCLGDAGYISPTGVWDASVPSQGSTYYAVGFPVANGVPNQIVVDNGGMCGVTGYGVAAFKKVGGVRMVVANIAAINPALRSMGDGSQTVPGVSNDGGFFVAGAIGVLDSTKTTPALADKWAIDQDKSLYNLNVGY